MSLDLSNRQPESFLSLASYIKERGQITVFGKDWILVETGVFKSLFEGTEKMLGSAAVPVWFSIAKHAGRELMKPVFKEDESPQIAVDFLEAFFTKGGWGKVQITMNFAEKQATVSIENCATARNVRSEEPVCHFVRGFISGVADIIFKSATDCVEAKCLAKGDPVCEFKVKETGYY